MEMSNENTAEIWMPIKDWEPLYEASNFGRIRSIKREKEANYGTRVYGGKVLVGAPIKGGYILVNFRDAETKRHVSYKVHSLILSSFVGPRPEGMEARHKDGDPSNNALSNLAWGTRHENGADKTLHGRSAGQKNHNSKLTNDQAISIKSAAGRHIDIAALYGVSEALVGQIKRGVAWKHLAYCAMNEIKLTEPKIEPPEGYR